MFLCILNIIKVPNQVFLMFLNMCSYSHDKSNQYIQNDDLPSSIT